MNFCGVNNKGGIDLRKELHNTLVVIGLITEVVLSDNNLLEDVSINDIYKTLFCVFKSRYMDILNEIQMEERQRGVQQQGNTSPRTMVQDPIESRDNIKTIHQQSDPEKNAMAEEIKLRFSQMFFSTKKNKKELVSVSNLSCIKYAIAGCIYLHGKISNKKISLRNVLNTIDYNFFLLNNCINIVKSEKPKEDIENLIFGINQYEPIIKENIYHAKEESLKMERISLYASSFKLSNNIFKYSLLYELMFITRSPYIINKFLFSVFNDVICIPDINDKYNDTVIVISCFLFVNHFFYYINQYYKMNSQYFGLVKKMYLLQVEKIMNIFQLLNPDNCISELKNVISLTSKIIRLYSLTY
ncbi:conserved Plasmodium protein, unknown function [Plasmodium ovale]|uniref:Uncharacterized protein n=2 Tax=Plasmodium ovale TaxID=36330 RepID=A0A1A8WFZ3_PLAOA|nr:conserved Plasmodium protein, unknown function [Plasmodium ovale curtisi]SBS90714.1 conserved Plasmodium protein, unknown function [Plasmodium ovale curtisi]SCP04472.1 conserved Plasmodium protein, unknown function [Plasmodium ovale]